jgi:hypothetical protein
VSKVRKSLLTCAAAVGALVIGATPALSTAAPAPTPNTTGDPVAASPYFYNGWANPPAIDEVMRETGIKDFTLAFILSDGTCNPAWDGERPLDGPDKATIQQVRAGGGDVIPSIGGWAGNKLGEVCQDAQSLASAYQQLIDAYELKAIDVDIENTEFESLAAQDRVLEALKIVKEANPGLRTVVTFPTLIDGPNDLGKRMISKAKEIGANVDVWTQMPFNFDGTNMVADTISATEGLKRVLKRTFGYSNAEAYAHMGISSMNGKTDAGETVDQAAFQKMAYYAAKKGLGRFTFWSVNRDRPCEGEPNACSGIDQQPWDFTKIVAGVQR